MSFWKEIEEITKIAGIAIIAKIEPSGRGLFVLSSHAITKS
jgi:hypothetical protein